MRSAPKIAIWTLCILVVLFSQLFAAAFFIDEPLRRRMEANMNRSLEGYRVELPGLDFNPIGFSVILENLVLYQKAHPDPPVGRFEKLRASVHVRALLKGRLVADFELDRPEIHVNLIQVRKEASEDVPVEERGWQGAVNAIYPLKVNLLTIRDGSFTYIDEDPERPLILREIFLSAENIRNVFSPESVYPSPFRFTSRVFEKGRAAIDGSANFLAEPHPGLEAELNLQDVEMDYFRPVLLRHNFFVSGGLLSARGRTEYAPNVKTAHLISARIDGLKMDYVHSAATAEAEKAKAEKAKEAAKEATNQPGLLLRVDDMRITGDFGFVNEAQSPSYRVFLQRAELRLNNLSNQFREGEAEASLDGYFMGSGKTGVLARFRPEKDGPDFDLYIRVLATRMKSMNNLLRAYAKLDVVEGSFSLFTEMRVRDGRVAGYVKPFFRDLDIYDPRQDEEKNLFQKLYEGVIDGIFELLKNEASEKVATKADISGPIENPDARTWQIVVNLIRNAFFQVILPGFEENVGRK